MISNYGWIGCSSSNNYPSIHYHYIDHPWLLIIMDIYGLLMIIDYNGFQIQDFLHVKYPSHPGCGLFQAPTPPPRKRTLGTAVSERTRCGQGRAGRGGPKLKRDFTDLTASKENIQYKKWIEMTRNDTCWWKPCGHSLPSRSELHRVVWDGRVWG